MFVQIILAACLSCALAADSTDKKATEKSAESTQESKQQGKRSLFLGDHGSFGGGGFEHGDFGGHEFGGFGGGDHGFGGTEHHEHHQHVKTIVVEKKVRSHTNNTGHLPAKTYVVLQFSGTGTIHR